MDSSFSSNMLIQQNQSGALQAETNPPEQQIPEMDMMPPPTVETAPPKKTKRRKPRKIPWQTADFTLIGRQIAQARRNLGLTQLMLANRCSTHQGTISQIEAGKRDVKFSLIIRVCKAVGLEFGVDPPILVPSPNE